VKRRTGTASRNMRWIMLGGGLAVGLVFAFAALLLVTPKSTLAFALFTLACGAVGVLTAWVCYLVAVRESERALSTTLEHARTRLGIEVRNVTDIDGMAAEFERLFKDVSGILSQARMVNSDIRALTAQVLTATDEQASGAAQQAAAVTETSATVEELAQTSKQIAENSQSVAAIAERTLSSAEEGMQTVADTADGIEEIRTSTQAASDRILALGERSQEIGRVLVIIDDIAEQTKILALNAAIEAARAGEAGKGFAVVAEEIRKLADSVTESTSEIGRVVREIQSSASSLVMSTEKASKKVDEGKMLAGRTADSLERIVHQVEETTDSAKQISIATQQQRTASDQVVISMREMAQVATQSAESSRQIQSAIMELNRLADTLEVR
jgi:methyl-accepting chemotaxis protein